MSTLTNSIEKIETVIDHLVEKLESSEECAWRVYKFSGTNFNKLFELLPEATPPALIVIWQGAIFNREPGRPQRVYHDMTILVLEEDPQLEEGARSSRNMIDEVLNLVDDEVYGNVNYRVLDVQSVDFTDANVAPNVSCYMVNIEVGDH